jgi:pyridoxamine 5'-phosphate oxidase
MESERSERQDGIDGAAAPEGGHRGGRVEHRDYAGDGLTEAQLPPSPWPVVKEWVEQARARVDPVHEPDALSVATADGSGQPHVRTVLLRYLQADGLGFYTNLESRKGQDLAVNPKIAVALTWPSIFRAIRLVGRAELLPRSVVQEYFDGRPWGSQVGAWASEQSHEAPDRAALEGAVREAEARWPEGTPVLAPPFWGGYVIRATEVELWAGRRSRLHDRLVYVRDEPAALDAAGWRIIRRQP